MSNSISWVELEVLEVCYQVKYWEQTGGLLGIEVWGLIGMPALWPWTAGLNMHLYITLQAKGLCLLLGVQQRGSPCQKPGRCSCTAQVHPSQPLHSHLAQSGWLWCVWWQRDRGAQELYPDLAVSAPLLPGASLGAGHLPGKCAAGHQQKNHECNHKELKFQNQASLWLCFAFSS